MHHFYLPPEHCLGPILLLSGREGHHARHVLRLRRGERVRVLDGQGQKLECEVEEPASDHLGLKLLERRSVAPLPYQITLVQAIPKGKLIESIIQKAAELGAFRIVPLLTERTVTRVNEADASDKVAKWRLVAIEAIKQCGSAWLPRVETPLSVEQFLSQRKEVDLALVGSLQGDARHPRTYFEDFKHQQRRKPKSVSVAIGPEGDFTTKELAALETAGAQPIGLGSLVLRTETAAVYCLSIINYELQSGSGREME
jgi:16S rRNA (uracil1498-N3)-methyltransferase